MKSNLLSNQIIDVDASRFEKGKKIISIIQFRTSSDLKDKKCLDIGCSTGEITEFLSEYFGSVIGFDINKDAIVKNKKYKSQPYVLASSSAVPFRDSEFDVIICAQVYEHVESQELLVEEIKRLLKKDGVCFFSGPNKYALMEEHYLLPLLSWFPKKISGIYMKLFKKGNYYEPNPLSYKSLKHLLIRFCITDYTIQLIRNPNKFSMPKSRISIFLKKMPNWLLHFFLTFTPNFNFILEHSHEESKSE